jgi:trk system potassium uptake protein TrkA
VIRDIADEVTHAVRADITDRDALVELGVAAFDTAIIGVAGNLEASILCTVILKQMGIPRILAKAGSDIHGSILQQVGATRIAYPEQETGLRVAHSFAAPGVHDYLDVAPGYGIARVPVAAQWRGKRLGDIDLRRTCGVTVLALGRGAMVTLNPHASEALDEGTDLIVAGLDEDLARLPGTEQRA